MRRPGRCRYLRELRALGAENQHFMAKAEENVPTAINLMLMLLASNNICKNTRDILVTGVSNARRGCITSRTMTHTWPYIRELTGLVICAHAGSEANRRSIYILQKSIPRYGMSQDFLGKLTCLFFHPSTDFTVLLLVL